LEISTNIKTGTNIGGRLDAVEVMFKALNLVMGVDIRYVHLQRLAAAKPAPGETAPSPFGRRGM